MKKFLTILCLVLLTSCSPSEVPFDIEVSLDDLVQRQGVYYEINSQKPYSGRAVSHYENGQLEFKNNYKDGEPDGPFELYYENGQLYDKGNYKGGKPDGPYENYHENGQLKGKGNFKDGGRDGLWEAYNEDGELMSKTNYKDGELID